MIETVAVTDATVGPRRTHVTWTAIFAGWVVAFGIAWILYLLGLAVGFTSFDLSNTEVVAKGVGIGTTVWIILTWAVSLFLGGMFASWVDGRADQTVGTLHGVAVWGLAMTLSALLAAMGFTQLLQGGASLVKGATAAGVAGAAAGAQASGTETPLAHATAMLGSQVKRAMTDRGAAPASSAPAAAGTSAPAPTTASTTTTATATSSTTAAPVDNAAMTAIATDLLRGKNDDARARLVAESGMQPADADKVMQGLQAQVEAAKTQLREAADQARRYAAAAMWALLLSSLIALIAAALGGAMGAGNIHRVHDVPRI